MMQRPLGIAIIGAGQIIKRHALAYRAFPDAARLVAVADIDEGCARRAQERYGFQVAFKDYSDLLNREDVDSVSICTPAFTHARIAADALRAGKHVLCEKPLATNLAEADSLIDVADKHPDLTACCVFQLRADPVHRRLGAVVSEGQLGRILRARMRMCLHKSPSYFATPGRGSVATDGGGVLINQAIHALDALLALLGEPVEVSAAMDTFVHPIEAEDTLVGWIRFAGGAIAVIECSTCAKRKEYEIEIVGNQAAAVIWGDPDSQRFFWRVDSPSASTRRSVRSCGLEAVPHAGLLVQAARGFKRLGKSIQRRQWLPPTSSGHAPFVREFLSAAASGQSGPMPFQVARRSLALTAALYESAKARRAILLTTDEATPVPRRVGPMSSRRAAEAASARPGQRSEFLRNQESVGSKVMTQDREPVNQKKLALFGGRRTVYGMFPSPWTRMKRAVVLTGDVLKMVPRIARGKTTIGDGSKIIHKFENAFKKLTGAKHALAMNSGTATLHSAYFAVGVGPGHEVIVPAYTWHASATPILQCGATPVFCDIDPNTLTADPDDIERRITPRTKAICVVHVWGNPAEMDRITEIARRRNLAVIEDCSHAHGAVYQGKPVGRWGHVGCFSLNASKAVDGGEAGVAITDDPRLFDHMLVFGHFGRVERGQAAKTFHFGDMSLGHKFRPHQCAMQLAYPSLKRLPGLNRRCTRAWRRLCDELRGVEGIRVQESLPGAVRGGFQSFVLVYEGAELGGLTSEEFVKAVRAEGAPVTLDRYSQVNFTYGMLHRAPLFTELRRPDLGGCCYDPTRPWEELVQSVSLPVSERLCRQLVSLPRLDSASLRYVGACGRAIRKVLAATLPSKAVVQKPKPRMIAIPEKALG